jgi:hypothetical protein
MSVPWVYVAIAVVLAALLTYLAARRSKGPLAIDKARALMGSLDIDAFRNLVDPEEDVFLRSSLPADQFRTIKRERAWAALAYVRTLSHIALEFSRFGHAMRSSPDPTLAELGRHMVSSAVYLRLRALEASGRLLIAATFPDLPQRCPHSLFEQYARATSLLLRYGKLDHARKQPS